MLKYIEYKNFFSIFMKIYKDILKFCKNTNKNINSGTHPFLIN